MTEIKMTETEFRGLKLMMLERYRRNQGGNRDARREIRGYSITSNINNDYKTGAKQEFGIRDGGTLDAVLHTCFKKAFGDALASSESRSQVGGVTDSCDQCWDFLCNDFSERVLPLIRVRTQDDFDCAHRNLSTTICENQTQFTFGNAQKLINMMLKYCYVLSLYYSNTKDTKIKEFVKIINRLAPFMHVPIDTIILMVLRGDVLRMEDDHDLITKPDLAYKIKAGNTKYSWSKLPAYGQEGYDAGYDAYMKLQQRCRERALNDFLFPIAWECKEWFNAR